MITQTECFECTDYIDTIDFSGELICPCCYQSAKRKLAESLAEIKRLNALLAPPKDPQL